MLAVCRLARKFGASDSIAAGLAVTGVGNSEALNRLEVGRKSYCRYGFQTLEKNDQRPRPLCP